MIKKLSIKSMTNAQFRQLVAIEHACGLEPYTPEMLFACIRDMDTYAWMDDHVVAGFITVHPSTRYLVGGVYIVNLNVAGAYRRRGIGKALIRYAAAEYAVSHAGQQMVLDVARDNLPAMNLYNSLGFTETEIPSDNGETDMVMTVDIDTLVSGRNI